MICSQLPPACRLRFDSIVISTKFPISIQQVKKGKLVRIPIGVVTPQKNMTFEGDEISSNTMVKGAHLKAKMISKPIKARGSGNHNKFSYKVKKGEIVMPMSVLESKSRRD